MPRFREELILGGGGAPGGEDVLALFTLILARSAATLSASLTLPHPLAPFLPPYYQLIILSHSSKLEKVECVSASPARRPRAERRLNGRNSPRSSGRMKHNIVSGTKAAL